MKPIYYSTLLLFLLWGCSSSQSGVTNLNRNDQISTNGGVTSINDPQPNQSLETILRRLPGLTVTGSGDALKIRVRGVSNSFKMDNTPLFVLNGINLGTDYSSISRAVIAADIKEIKVLKGPTQTTLYGANGANGVIVIKTKSAGN